MKYIHFQDKKYHEKEITIGRRHEQREGDTAKEQEEREMKSRCGDLENRLKALQTGPSTSQVIH